MAKAFLFAIIFAVMACGQTAPRKRARPFDPKEYPARKFKVTRKDYPFGGLTVRVISVKNLGYTMDPQYCRAWLDVRRGDQLLKRLYYTDIDFEPVGFSFGVFVPKRQPSPDYFAVVKEGNYDGRLLLIDLDGKVVDLPGGFYFVTNDRKFLISEYASDATGLAVFDFCKKRIVLQDMAGADGWYRDSKGYFFTDASKPGNGGRLDLQDNRVVSINVSESDLRKATKVQYEFDPRQMQDCVSTPQ